jgi:hypothetical protein
MELESVVAGSRLAHLWGAWALGTAAYEATGNLATVMKVMGDTDVRTSIRYQRPGFESDVEWPNISSASAASQSSTAWPSTLARWT